MNEGFVTQNMHKQDFSGLHLPPVIFGTSGLGNLFEAIAVGKKLDIVSECVRLSKEKVVFDSAGKYGTVFFFRNAGQMLKQLNVHPDYVVISNKPAWVRRELKKEEPTFEL